MVNVLIVGATGYIGQALCQSLIRSGNHRVFGLARTPEKANSLAKSEVIPIIGSIADNAKLVEALSAHHINVVVDVAGANKESHDLLTLLKKVSAERLKAASDAGVRIPKLGFIYGSGIWVHGSSNAPINDLMPVGVLNAPNAPAELISWRPELEQAVLAASDVLDVMVIRPALVYGRSSALWSVLFGPIYDAVQEGSASASVAADPESRPGLIHVGDVASGFHAAIDRLPLISGTGVYPIFDLVTSQESMRDILTSFGQELGFNGTVDLKGCGSDVFANAMSTSSNGTGSRAKTLLGWEPKRIGFVQSMDIYAKAWVASKL